MIGTAYCSIAVFQSVLLSGGTFNRLSEFGEFTCEISFVKSPRTITKESGYVRSTHNICSADKD